jgi:hypothetical protein
MGLANFVGIVMVGFGNAGAGPGARREHRYCSSHRMLLVFSGIIEMVHASGVRRLGGFFPHRSGVYLEC